MLTRQPTDIQSRSPTEMIAAYVTRARFEDLPPVIVSAAKRYILDALGNMIGGAVLDPARIILDLFTEMRGTPEATILATGIKVPVLHAAYVNSSLANLLDFDDTYRNFAHPGATTIPPALALGEKLGASGRELINAVVVGYEVMLRVGTAIKASPERYRQVSGLSTWQSIGAAVVAAKLYGLDVHETRNALGLGAFNAPVPNMRKEGLEFAERPYGWTKNNYGWASMGGVLGAMLAARGFNGNRHIFDGERGFWIIAGSDRCDFDQLTGGLGETYLMPDTGFKPYAACRWTHTSLDALRRLMREQRVDVSNVARIEVRTFFELCNHFGNEYTPRNVIDMQMNLAYLLAAELTGHSSSEGLTEDLLTDPLIVDLAGRVDLLADSEADQRLLTAGEMLSTVTLVLADGRRLTAREETPTGDPGRELSDDELRTKFRTLTKSVIGPQRCERILAAVDRLERLERVDALTGVA